MHSPWTDWWSKSRNATSSHTCCLKAIFQVHKSNPCSESVLFLHASPWNRGKACHVLQHGWWLRSLGLSCRRSVTRQRPEHSRSRYMIVGNVFVLQLTPKSLIQYNINECKYCFHFIVYFTNLHRGHIWINVMDSSTIE